MITIRYFHGLNKKLQDKVNFKHGERLYNTQINDVINKILKAKLNIMIIQKNNSILPYKEYTIFILD